MVMKAGILLPKSTTHPTIGYDFLTGMKLAMERHAGISCNWTTANIGFGVDAQLLVEKAEQLCLNEGVDVLVVFADHPRVNALFPVVKALNKCLLVVSAGAKYPISWEREDHVIYLTLNEYLLSGLTGVRAASDGYRSGAIATNFYDGGYAMASSIAEEFNRGGGNIAYNFIGRHLEDEFDTNPLLNFLDACKEPLAVLATFSGALTSQFVHTLGGKLPEQVRIYCNPTMLAEWEAEPDKAGAPALTGYAAWSPAIALEENQAYITAFQSGLGREATAIGALGWDAGQVLAALAAGADEHGWKGANILPWLAQQAIAGARGELVLDSTTHYYLAPAYWIDSGRKDSVVGRLTAAEVQQAWEQQVSNLASPPQTGWFNTYLCS